MYIVFYVDTYVVNEEVAVEGKEISFLFEHVLLNIFSLKYK